MWSVAAVLSPEAVVPGEAPSRSGISAGLLVHDSTEDLPDETTTWPPLSPTTLSPVVVVVMVDTLTRLAYPEKLLLLLLGGVLLVVVASPRGVEVGVK